VAGYLLRGYEQPRVITVTTVQTVTVAEVQKPPSHYIAPYKAYARITCIYTVPEDIGKPDCPQPNVKAVQISVGLTNLGTENAYLTADSMKVMAPGLEYDVTLEGNPRDAVGRVVIMPRSFNTEVTALARIVDETSFNNWLNDFGTVTIVLDVKDRDGNTVQTIQAEQVRVEVGGTG